MLASSPPTGQVWLQVLADAGVFAATMGVIIVGVLLLYLVARLARRGQRRGEPWD